jgi:hypothetical protein
MHRLLPRDVGDARRSKSSLPVRYVVRIVVPTKYSTSSMEAKTGMWTNNINETYFVFRNRFLCMVKRELALCM